jgi:ubiquinone/menaquinone biosynthesis C-methylase UbiE
MAKTWHEAQAAEKAFWESIYVGHKADIASYRPISDEEAASFTTTAFRRFSIHISSIKGKMLVDLGCGPYGVLKGLSSMVEGKFIGIDPLMDTYRRFGTLPSGVELLTAMGEQMPLDDASADFILSTNVLDHVNAPESVVKEVRRVLKRGGRFLPNVHVLYPAWRFSGPALKYLDENHPHHFTEATFSQILRKHFNEVVVTYRSAMFEDQPEFRYPWRSPNILRGIKRFASHYILYSAYFSCA